MATKITRIEYIEHEDYIERRIITEWKDGISPEMERLDFLEGICVSTDEQQSELEARRKKRNK